MTVVVSTPNVQVGDRERTLDTSTKAARRKLERTIDRKKREGAAIFVGFMGDTFRVERYDSARDELVVRAKKAARGPRLFRINAANTKITVVAPIAGG